LQPTRKIITINNQQYVVSQGGQGTFFLGITKVIHTKYYQDLKMGWFSADFLACTSNKNEILNKIGIWILILNFQVNLECFFTQKNLKSENNNP
jgi:hypothetical protein